MTIDISSILKENGGRINIDGSVMLSDTEFLGEYHFKEPFKVSGSVSNNGKSFILRMTAIGNVITQCARCMEEITVPVKLDITENLKQDDGENYDDDVIVFSDTTFEADGIIRDNFLMNTTGKYLCSENCKGLCPKCGKDLNEGDCGCPEEEIDPRWSALLDIMKKNK